ncbi:signal peptidase II [Aestuariivita boseongensis]|uniref:signal peptidase II n=1 Tax=Aestuariivita boseongensis TaxID=1470562 RepID=UPI00068363BC|nr:signal peptidase II [Aestuariivita boseongensis]
MRPVFWTTFWVFLVDQASKYVMLHVLALSQVRSIDVLPPLLRFRYGENRGINFGLFGDAPDVLRWVLVGFSILVVVGVSWWIRRFEGNMLMLVSAGMLIGGALGNVVDRIAYGFVVDFLNMSCCGIDNPFVFNIADIFIFAGAIGLILFEGRARGKKAS